MRNISIRKHLDMNDINDRKMLQIKVYLRSHFVNIFFYSQELLELLKKHRKVWKVFYDG